LETQKHLEHGPVFAQAGSTICCAYFTILMAFMGLEIFENLK